MPRPIFRDGVIAAAGPLPGQLTVDNLRRWTRLRQGSFSDDFGDAVTHLLCTQEQFRQRVPRVREALKRGKRCHIVHHDWFEFSTVWEKREPEREYSMRHILAKQNAARRGQGKIERGKKEGEKSVNTNLYHIYQDREFFPYQIEMTRDGDETGEPQDRQRYILSLWESNAKPHLYWFTAKFLRRKGDGQLSYHRPSRCSGKWRREMDMFMDFFRIKTGVEWQDRVLREKTMASSFFHYATPTHGKPVGRRLRFCLDHCRQVNAEIRGLPWPPVEGPVGTEPDDTNTDAKAEEAEGSVDGSASYLGAVAGENQALIAGEQDDSPDNDSVAGGEPEDCFSQ
ncbi:hypothetical protein G6O67_002176 [Ophiocordyceps sinensis]|uniref:BRCT domain-containing protein n=2 Tax=Ophiocordyceps sinensis TaxID=72228 RepID=A0A8H4V789_9HYPO|nr:anthranilate synthase component II [Ophiocordyceps sinensis CO18]KAF4510275.1 hypothetical protein G6O67_002176 [Ophiocordyceps sinensis]